jgi:tetratricopeptide (TPR) repeat protein
MLHQLRGRYQTARLQLETSVSVFEGLNRPRDQARALNRLAYVARFQRDFEAASKLAEQASQLLDPEDPEQAFSHFVVGLVALDERDWPKAVHFSRQAFDLWAQENNQRMMGRSLMCRGVALEKMKAYPEAMAVCEQAVALFETIQDPVYLAAAQMNLGNVYHALERFNEALECYLPAERVFRQTQDQSHSGDGRSQYRLHLSLLAAMGQSQSGLFVEYRTAKKSG